MALVAGHEERDEGPAAVVDAAPADAEGALPLRAVGLDEAPAAAHAGVVEHEVHVVGAVLGQHLLGELLHVGLVGDVGAVDRDARAGRGLLLGAASGLLEVVQDDVARRDVAPLGGQLDHQLAAHAGAAAGDHGQLPLERLHRLPPDVDAVCAGTYRWGCRPGQKPRPPGSGSLDAAEVGGAAGTASLRALASSDAFSCRNSWPSRRRPSSSEPRQALDHRSLGGEHGRSGVAADHLTPARWRRRGSPRWAAPRSASRSVRLLGRDDPTGEAQLRADGAPDEPRATAGSPRRRG